MNANGCELVTGTISTYCLAAVKDIERKLRVELENRKFGQGQIARDAIAELQGDGMNQMEYGGQLASYSPRTHSRPLDVQEQHITPGRLPALEGSSRSAPKHAVEEVDEIERVMHD